MNSRRMALYTQDVYEQSYDGFVQSNYTNSHRMALYTNNRHRMALYNNSHPHSIALYNVGLDLKNKNFILEITKS